MTYELCVYYEQEKNYKRRVAEGSIGSGEVSPF